MSPLAESWGARASLPPPQPGQAFLRGPEQVTLGEATEWPEVRSVSSAALKTVFFSRSNVLLDSSFCFQRLVLMTG